MRNQPNLRSRSLMSHVRIVGNIAYRGRLRVIKQIEKLTGHEPEHIMVDRGYRGHDYQGIAAFHIAGRIPKNATRLFGKMLKRRCVVEPTIG